MINDIMVITLRFSDIELTCARLEMLITTLNLLYCHLVVSHVKGIATLYSMLVNILKFVQCL